MDFFTTCRFCKTSSFNFLIFLLFFDSVSQIVLKACVKFLRIGGPTAQGNFSLFHYFIGNIYLMILLKISFWVLLLLLWYWYIMFSLFWFLGIINKAATILRFPVHVIKSASQVFLSSTEESLIVIK